MPGTTRNRDRVAELCSEATGLSYRTARAWAAGGIITRQCPVPDADHPDQRALEAEMVLQLSTQGPPDGALLGFTRIVPRRDGLELWLRPDAAHQVLGRLLPRWDLKFGVPRGILGLRPAREDGSVRLHSLVHRGSVLLRDPDQGWAASFFAANPCFAHFWKDSLDRLNEDEQEWLREPHEDESDPDRNRLLSRLMRRSRFLGAGRQVQKWTGTYSWQRRELAIEWRCTTEPEDLAALLRRSGLTAGPSGTEERTGCTLTLGGAAVTVRRPRAEYVCSTC